jgi:hypothetical protein
MSWLFSQALVEEYLEANCLDGEQSVPSNGSRTQQAYCAPDKMMAFSKLSRYGMTYKPLTDILGEELSMSSVVAFHVRTLVQQEKAQELMESDQECGEKWRGSFTKYSQDTCSWKTHQCSLLGDLEEFSETWPAWGLMRDGECWEQTQLAHPTKESAFGFTVPTPVASDGTTGSLIGKNDSFYETRTGMPRKVNQNGKDGSVGLGRLVKMWPTPDANCGMKGTQPNWTPKRKSGHQAQYSINQAVRDAERVKFPTPQASDHRDRGNMSNPSIQRRAEKGKQLNLSMVVHPTSGQLNPTWVEWLMGWPLGWTDLKPLEMDKFHYVQQQLGDS